MRSSPVGASRKDRSPIASLVAVAGSSDTDDRPWRELAEHAGALAFETDAAGFFTFVGPRAALGWVGADLVGQRGDLLLADLGGRGFNPFLPETRARHARCWLRRRDGSIACLSFSVGPLSERDGRVIGTCGLGIDLSELDATEKSVSSALRRADIVDYLLRSTRVELLPDRMVAQTLRSLVNALGAAGALVVDAAAEPSLAVLHEIGGDADNVVRSACDHLRPGAESPAAIELVDGRPIIMCPCPTRFGSQTGLVLWRRADVRRWDTQDLAILVSAASLIRVLMEHGYVQSEMAVHARTDALTGLANRRAFLEEVPRRIDRLDRDQQPGTMMLITLDGFRSLNDMGGHDVGDEALRIAAALLRTTFRPGDILARLSGAEFAVWLDGADELTAAERAEALCTDGVEQFRHLGGGSVALGISIGLAMRWAGGMEDTEELRHRAGLAIATARQVGASGWRVWHPEP